MENTDYELIEGASELELENRRLKAKLKKYEQGYWGQACLILEKRNRYYKEALETIALSKNCDECRVTSRPKACKTRQCEVYIAERALKYKG